MNKETFEKLAGLGKLDQVMFQQVGQGTFELWVHATGDTKGPVKFKAAPEGRSDWDSLDTLFELVRGMGYAGKIVIDSDSDSFAIRPGGQVERHRPPMEEIEEGERKAREGALRIKGKLKKKADEEDGDGPTPERDRGG